MSEEIKKCPFCGKPGETTGSTMYSCSDPNCPAFTIVGMERAAWNKRVMSPAVEALVKAAKRVIDEEICLCKDGSTQCAMPELWAALKRVEEEMR